MIYDVGIIGTIYCFRNKKKFLEKKVYRKKCFGRNSISYYSIHNYIYKFARKQCAEGKKKKQICKRTEHRRATNLESACIKNYSLSLPFYHPIFDFKILFDIHSKKNNHIVFYLQKILKDSNNACRIVETKLMIGLLCVRF